MNRKPQPIVILLLCCLVYCSHAKAGGIAWGANGYLQQLTAHGPVNAKVVYRQDTIKGTALFIYDQYAPIPKERLQERCFRMFLLLKSNGHDYRINVSDTALTYMALTHPKTGKVLLMVKFPNVDTWLRVVHTGKLCIYDCAYSFDYRHVYNLHSWAYRSTLLSRGINPFAGAPPNTSIYRYERTIPWDAHVTVANGISWKNIIAAINDVYHLHLSPDDYPRKGREKKLAALVASLDK